VEQIFNPEKAAQIAARFIELNGGSVNRYALIKMMYEADREACRRWSYSMTGDQPYSMQYGPILSQITNLTKGVVSQDASTWREHINPVDGEDTISLAKDIPDKDLLSSKDEEIVKAVYAKLGSMSFKQLRDYSHAHPEYDESVGRGAKSISIEDRLAAVGKTPEQINAASDEVSEEVLRSVFKG
jgi:uncharacterized phage-associated protein